MNGEKKDMWCGEMDNADWNTFESRKWTGKCEEYIADSGDCRQTVLDIAID